MSGQRLRDWLGLNEAKFYDENLVAVMPMAFCYPGKVNSGSGDKAPPAICSRTWHKPLLEHMTHIKLTLIIGNYAAKAYGNWAPTDNLTDKIKSNREGNNTFVLPHPSPRNNIWLSKNAWFETKTLPMVRQRIQDILNK